MKQYSVKLLAAAKHEYAMARAWWRLHRPAAPDALRDEMRAARTLLSANPEAGRLDEGQTKLLRRLILPGVRYVLYYRVDDAARQVVVIAFWHANRQPPEL